MLLLSLVVAVPLTANAAATWAASPGATGVDPERMDGFVAEQMTRADVPGVAYAVVGPKGVEHQATFGHDGDGDPVTVTTPFLWGSVAKPVTASLIVTMDEAGELDLDTRVTAYLPDFAMADDQAREITLRNLATHTSGIPELMDLADDYNTDRRPGDVLDGLAQHHLASDVGEEHTYSSINYMLLGAVVEKVTGRPFAEVLRERILEPAGMDTSIVTPREAADRLPPGHRYVFGHARAFQTGFDPAGVSSGYLGGSLQDAVGFARANLPGSQVLTPVEQSVLVHPEVPTGEDRSYGLGWRVWPVFGSDQPMIWHAGAAPGYQAAIVLLPERHRAVVVLQNSYGSFQESELLDTPWGLASILAGAEPARHGVDSLYVVLLATLGLVCFALLTAVGVSLRRITTPRPARSRRRRTMGLAGWLVGLLVTAGGLLALPPLFKIRLRQVSLWAPDVAALLYAGLALTAVLVLCRIAVTARTSSKQASDL